MISKMDRKKNTSFLLTITSCTFLVMVIDLKTSIFIPDNRWTLLVFNASRRRWSSLLLQAFRKSVTTLDDDHHCGFHSSFWCCVKWLVVDGLSSPLLREIMFSSLFSPYSTTTYFALYRVELIMKDKISFRLVQSSVESSNGFFVHIDHK